MGKIVPSLKNKEVFNMTYYRHQQKLLLIPERFEEPKWFIASFLVIAGISLIITMAGVGGLIYLLNHPTVELLIFTGGSLALGLVLLLIASNELIRDKIQSVFFSSPNTIEFTEKRILIKDFEEDSIRKTIPSSELESLDIDIERKTQRLKPSASFIRPRNSYPITTYSPIPSITAKNILLPSYTKIKSINMILKLKKGQQEFISLEDYSHNEQDQKNLLRTILDYCRKKYDDVEIPESFEIELFHFKPQIKY
jgi:hypothetical protein